MTRKDHIACGLGALLLVAITAGLFINSVAHRDRSEPPPGVRTLDAFLTEMDRPEHAYELTLSGSTYTELIAGKPLWTLASGPPAYVFDASGELVDHTLDDGDDHAYDLEWRRGSRRLMTPEQTERLLGVRFEALR